MKVSAKHVTRRKAQESTGFTIAQNGTRSDGRSQRLSESGNKKRQPQKKEWKWQRDVVTHPLSERPVEQGSFQHGKVGVREAQEPGHASRRVQRATLQRTDHSGACGWSVVQLDYDAELGPLFGMYGSTEAEFEVQHTTKRVKMVRGPITVHVDNKGIVDGLWKGEVKCIDPKTDDADLWKN